MIAASKLEELLQVNPPERLIHQKSRKEGENDPWLVFHSSGTTGKSRRSYSFGFERASFDCIRFLSYPKSITYTDRMMAIPAVAARLMGDEKTCLHHDTSKRWCAPLRMIHVHQTEDVPWTLDCSCRNSHSFTVCRNAYGSTYEYFHSHSYGPLSINSSKELSSNVRPISRIDSTEAGAYFSKTPSRRRKTGITSNSHQRRRLIRSTTRNSTRIGIYP